MNHPIDILLVEDNEADVLLAREAFSDTKVSNNLHIARDGEEAMSFLRRQGGYSEAPRPDLIFLDINMPRKNGLEVLREVKSDPELGCIPILMLTTSQSEDDVSRCYAAHASGYVVKPVGFANFQAVVRAFEGFWLNFVQFPPKYKAG